MPPGHFPTPIQAHPTLAFPGAYAVLSHACVMADLVITVCHSLTMTLKLLTALAALAGAQAFVILPEDFSIRGPPELPVPTRPLEWGDVNFLSTSDTHGELANTHPVADNRLASRTPARKFYSLCIKIVLTAEHLARARTPSGKSTLITELLG